MIKFSDVYTSPKWAKVLYTLLQVRTDGAKANISHQTMPTWEQHLEFMARKPYYLWFIILTKHHTDVDVDLPIGALSVTPRNEIGIMLMPEHRRRGYASQAIKHLLKYYPPLPAIHGERPATFVANIHPENEASIRLFTSLGAVHIQNTYSMGNR